MNAKQIAQFWQKVDCRGINECWPWKGLLDKKGYGRVGFGAQPFAHRVAYTLIKGAPGKLLVCHKCDNPPCVNPAHLWLGTQTDNMRDCWKKGRGKLMVHPRKLSDEQVAAVRRLFSEGRSQASLAREFGVGGSLIYRLVRMISRVPSE